MSDTDTPRDGATGQFASPEPLTGRAGLEADAGFRPMPDQKKEAASDEGFSVKEAAEIVASTRTEEPTLEIFYQDPNGEKLADDGKETVTPERAAQDLTAYRANLTKYAEGMKLTDLAGPTDAARGELLKANPDAADLYGIKEAKPEAKPAEAKADAKVDSAQAETTVDGLNPEVAKALQHPQVRQAVEAELGKADQARTQYEQAVQTANQYAQQSLVDHVPELAQIPVENWEAALTMLHQSGDPRVMHALGAIQRVAQTSAAQQQIQQQHAARQQQQFETWRQGEVGRLNNEFGEKVDRASFDGFVDYAQSLGVSRDDLKAIANNPLMHHAAFQKMMLDASRYHALKAAAPKSTRTVPTVQRSGVSQSRSSNTGVDALAAKFKSSSNLKDAAALLAARRKGR